MKIGRWALMLLVLLTGCVEPEAGYVTVILDDRVDEEPEALTKFAYYNPLHQTVFKYSTARLPVVWKDNLDDEDAEDQSFTFTTKEGASVSNGVRVELQMLPEKIPALVGEWKRPQSRLIEVRLRVQVEYALRHVASNTTVNELYGPGRITFQNQVVEWLNYRLSEEGVVIHQLTLIGETRLPDELKLAFQSRWVAEQRAREAEADVAEKQSEALQAAVVVQSELDSARMWAKINRELSESITPELIQYLLLRNERILHTTEPTCSEVP